MSSGVSHPATSFHARLLISQFKSRRSWISFRQLIFSIQQTEKSGCCRIVFRYGQRVKPTWTGLELTAVALVGGQYFIRVARGHREKQTVPASRQPVASSQYWSHTEMWKSFMLGNKGSDRQVPIFNVSLVWHARNLRWSFCVSFDSWRVHSH